MRYLTIGLLASLLFCAVWYLTHRDNPDTDRTDYHSIDSINRYYDSIIIQLNMKNDSMNAVLADVAKNKSKIIHKYDTIYISLDNLSSDSTAKLFSSMLDRYADTNWRKINNGF